MSFDPMYGCYDYQVKHIGERSEAEHTHKLDLKTELTVGGKKHILTEVKRDYSYKFTRHNQMDVPYQVVCSDQGNADCPIFDYGATTNEYSGNISEDFQVTVNSIVYMDLRHDLVILKGEINTNKFSGSGGEPLGTIMICDDVEGRIYPYYNGDTVGIPVSMQRTKRETMTINGDVIEDTVYDITENTTIQFNVGVSDHTGFQSLTNVDGGFPWETYGVVDTSYPYSYEDGFIPLYHIPQGQVLTGYSTPALYEYTPFWNNNYDPTLALKYETPFREYTDGMHKPSYPSDMYVNYGEFLGSCTFDRAGRYFASILTGMATPRVYYKLSDGDPVTLSEITGADPLFFPVGLA